ncbi:hypothetical protein MASR1M50_17130 [Burkholderiales bacterium]
MSKTRLLTASLLLTCLGALAACGQRDTPPAAAPAASPAPAAPPASAPLRTGAFGGTAPTPAASDASAAR